MRAHGGGEVDRPVRFDLRRGRKLARNFTRAMRCSATKLLLNAQSSQIISFLSLSGRLPPIHTMTVCRLLSFGHLSLYHLARPAPCSFFASSARRAPCPSPCTLFCPYLASLVFAIRTRGPVIYAALVENNFQLVHRSVHPFYSICSSGSLDIRRTVAMDLLYSLMLQFIMRRSRALYFLSSSLNRALHGRGVNKKKSSDS